ncbi:MAG: flagellar motor protein MotB [Nitrospira sp.]|jgi:chemotaxis protein MotB|nr:flagellar motor protein MotB [Nitrospira sp.]
MAKKKHEEHENHERWLVSYADFITLLFAFFVVMYSVSAVNEGKFRTVSESIKAALNPFPAPPTSMQPFVMGDNKPASINPPLLDAKEPVIRRIRDIVKTMLQTSQADRAPIVEERNGELVLTIPDAVLFKSGEATLLPEALPFLRALADVLVELNKQVRVEGHADNVPIRTVQFPSNWELSATRAVMIVRVLSELYGVPSNALSAVGYADARPVTDNLTPEHRAKNRRVEIAIMKQKDARRPSGDPAGPSAIEPAEDPAAAAATAPEVAPGATKENSAGTFK